MQKRRAIKNGGQSKTGAGEGLGMRLLASAKVGCSTVYICISCNYNYVKQHTYIHTYHTYLGKVKLHSFNFVMIVSFRSRLIIDNAVIIWTYLFDDIFQFSLLS